MDRLKVNTPVLLVAIHNMDVAIFQWMMKRKHLLRIARISRAISRTADGFGYPLLACGLWLWGDYSGRMAAAALLLTFALERPLYFILKRGLKRNRPMAALPNYRSFIIPSDLFSFPSGHTSGAFVTATVLAVFFPITALPAYCWAGFVGFSRITLGVHFPTDTVAGAAMGTLLALAVNTWLSL